jgi:serine beta-lactamase-like protein LACTB
MKKVYIILCLFHLNFCLAQVPAPKESIKNKAYHQAIERAHKYLDSLKIKQNIPGLSVSVGNANGILWAEGFGFADLESNLPVSIHSKFRLGSVSKSLTSLALGKLVENGQLDLDAPVQNYVPSFPPKKFSITARQLATHTSGIRHYREDDPLACPKRYSNVTEGLSIFAGDSLLFQPGSAYQYSTYGYTLLSAVLEGAGGKDYISLMNTLVFSPLGMTDTGPDYNDSLVSNRVRFYELRNGKAVNAALVDNSYKWAGGGLLSTPVDLVKMGAGLLKYSTLSKGTVERLFTPQLLSTGVNTYYGAGWRIGKDSQGRKIVHHGGLSDGGRAFLIIYPENDLVVAITANISGAVINLAEMDAIAACFFNTQR